MTSGVRPNGSFLNTAEKLFSGMGQDMKKLQRQLGTGLVAENYGELTKGRSTALVMRQRLAALQGYENVREQLSLRVQIMDTSLERIDALRSEVKKGARDGEFRLGISGQTVGQTAALTQLDEAIGLLNTEVGGRYVFSGRTVNTAPVEDTLTILNGDGAKAGLKTLISERRSADLGADGRGRLTTSVTTNAVSLTEDGTHPFGFKLKTITGPSSSSISVTTPAGSPPAQTLTVSSQPAEGDTVAFTFDLPDGTTANFSLRAGTATTNSTFAIGADVNATAANLRTALNSALQAAGETDLRAASAMAAADNFFSATPGNPPQRVSGSPATSATSLVAGTTANTVIWYQGDVSSDPRGGVKGDVDHGLTVKYGVQANEEGLRSVVKNAAVYASISFEPTLSDTKASHDALAKRVMAGLEGGADVQMVNDIRSEVLHAQTTLGSAKKRHDVTRGVLEGTIADIEQVDPNEIGVRLLALQTRMQASYAVTQRLSQMSLANYLT